MTRAVPACLGYVTSRGVLGCGRDATWAATADSVHWYGACHHHLHGLLKHLTREDASDVRVRPASGFRPVAAHTETTVAVDACNTGVTRAEEKR